MRFYFQKNKEQKWRNLKANLKTIGMGEGETLQWP